MPETIRCTINQQVRQITTDPRRTLLEVLREDLELTGTKFGCGEGHCRACTVLVDGHAVRACQTTLPEVAERRVETIESLATGDRLHPVQEAFVQEGAMQCGYCVPGMILTTVSLLRTDPRPSRDEILQALNGNLCRCCGYMNIVNAVERCAHGPGEGK